MGSQGTGASLNPALKVCFFFSSRRRHTRCRRDWSSDVCSSDLGIVISFIVVLLNMHTMVMERTREIGILKALGFSRFAVVRMLLTETFILALFGTGLGIALTFLTQFILRSEEHTSELQSRLHLVCRLLLEKKKNHYNGSNTCTPNLLYY